MKFIYQAKSLPLGTPLREQFFKEINFRNPPQNNNDNDTVVLIVNGTKLYANKGIMKVNNDTMFGRSNKGKHQEVIFHAISAKYCFENFHGKYLALRLQYFKLKLFHFLNFTGDMIAQVSCELAEECAKVNKTPLYIVEVN